jgi:tellurite resistance protein TehA-like permease
VWYALFVVESFLAIRFAMKLLQANPEAFFTNLIYTVSDGLVLPFVAVFKNTNMATSVFEWTTLLAMLIYWILAVAVIELFVMSKSVSATEADQKLVQ